MVCWGFNNNKQLQIYKLHSIALLVFHDISLVYNEYSSSAICRMYTDVPVIFEWCMNGIIHTSDYFMVTHLQWNIFTVAQNVSKWLLQTLA